MPRVSTFPDATTPLTGAETAYVIQGGSSRKTTVAELRARLAPLPTASAGTGNWSRQFVAASTSFTLPAGGTLAWMYFRRNTGTGGITAIDAGVSAGGTTILTLGAGEDLNALVWRLA